jgi:phosphatidylglycerophosphate synthase
MHALIIDAPSALSRARIYGLTLAQRAAFAATDAGAESVEFEAETAPLFSGLPPALNAKLGLRPRGNEGGERLIVCADALIAPALLASLELGDSIVDAQGMPCAARVRLDPGADAGAALQTTQPRAFAADRHHYALRVTARAQLPLVRQLLLRSLTKTSDGPVSRNLNRPLSGALTSVCVPLGITPNQMTVLVALAGLLAAYFAARPSYAAQLLGAVLFQLHSIIDGCDGEIARLTRRFGKHGALIDSLVDDASNTLFFAGLSFGVARAEQSAWPLYTGAVTVLCYAAVAWIQYGSVLRTTGKGEKTQFWRGTDLHKHALLRALHALGRRDVFVLVILLAVAAGLSQVVVAVLPLMALGALTQSVRNARALRNAGAGV